MSKWVEVTVKSVNTYLVELEEESPEEDAYDVVDSCISYDYDEMSCTELDSEDLEVSRRYVDKQNVISL